MEPTLNITEPNAETPMKINIKKGAKTRVKSNPYNKRYYTPEEVMGENWRDGLDEIEDEWE
jgi:hypothetical protein